jgi:processive 1,2-diacylglycerol beta-glucosyltransferase
LSFVAKIKKEFDVKLIVIVTDLRAHPFWANNAVDAYFVPLEETKNDLIKAGIAAEKITSGYVSLRDGFLNQLNDADIRKKFSFDDRPVILFMSSLRGNFPFFDEIVNRIKDKFNIFVIYGKNLELKAYLENLKIDNLRFLPSCEEIWEIFQISSVLVTKPGGLTTFEGVYKRKTFIFLRYIPGQEEENMKILIKHNIGRFARNTNEFFDALNYLTGRANTLKDDYPLKFTDIRKEINNTISRITKT